MCTPAECSGACPGTPLPGAPLSAVGPSPAWTSWNGQGPGSTHRPSPAHVLSTWWGTKAQGGAALSDSPPPPTHNTP